MVKPGYKQTEIGVIPEDWDCVKIGNVASVLMCKRIFADQTSDHGEIPFYKIGTFGKQADAFISRALYNEYKNKFSFPKEGDVLLSAAGTLGRTVVYDGKDAYFQDSNIVWLDIDKRVLCNEYLNHYYRVIKWMSSEGSTISRLYNGIICGTSIVIPPLPEQKRIAEALSDVDELISSLEKLIEKYKSIKATCLQQMFPQKGETTPKMRLPGFTGAWEQRKLGEVSDSYSGGTPTVGVKEYYGGQIPFIRSAEINSETTELSLTEDGLNNSSARLVDIGDILYALYGATSGEVGRARLKGAINQAVLAIKPHSGYDSEYLAQWLRKSKHSIIETYLQGGQGNLSGAIVKELLVDFPTLEEQQAIGAHFKQLDNLITLHQRKLDKAKKIKQGMMQQLLTGKIRLV